jgi:hypothetical protein
MDLHVLPECYVDTKLIKMIVPPSSGRYNHQKGTNVLARMMPEDKLRKRKAGDLHDTFALGIVDEDFEDRAYPKQFELIYHLPNQIKLKKHPDKHHYLIMICPVFEKWLLKIVDEMGHTMNDFGLPDDLEKLKNITKTSKSETEDPYSDNFRRLFKALRDTNPQSVILIRHWITYLKQNPFTADLTYLRQTTEQLISI